MAAAAAIARPIGKICLPLPSDYLAIATIGIAEIIRLRSAPKLAHRRRAGVTGVPVPSATSDHAPRRSPTWRSSPPGKRSPYLLVERQVKAP